MKNRIALIFEDPDMAKVLTYILEIQGFEVILVIEFSIKKYNRQENLPDLFIIQGSCKYINTTQIIEDLKGHIITENTPIMVVDYQENNQIDDYLLLGIEGCMIWPASPIQILSYIRNIITTKLNMDKINQMVELKTAELTEIQSVMIESLATLAEYRDPETGGHIKRTQNYVKALTLEVRKLPQYRDVLSDEEIELIYLSIPLHDIGKIGVRDDVLLKPGKLTDSEFELMKRHTEYGHEAFLKTGQKLKNKSFLNYADDVAYTHQEKWDGTGYPRGLKGEEIPLIGRLMALADVYDALISKRVYKEAMSHEEAKSIIVEGKGSHFDPTIVDAFLAIEDIFINISKIYADVTEVKNTVTINEEQPSVHPYKDILIVDDSKLMLNIYENQLRNEGFHVTTAQNGIVAIDLFLKNHFDVIITDLEMPILDGFELAKNIRNSSHPYSKSILIFALTATQYDMTKERAWEIGFNDYMLKPLDVELFEKKLTLLFSHLQT